ncbi:MAG: hypothetical protein HUJ25_03545 [Crocinitomicaceae bacterium]|nr:hypothetical protein [Crocinitomicaceae bacterium]
MKKFLFILIVLSVYFSHAQVYPQIGARSQALGGATLGLNDVFSAYNNPGAFGSMEETQVGLSVENRFLLIETLSQSLAFGYHTENAGNIGLHFQQTGFSLYRDMLIGMSYGMQFFDNFSAGISLNYHRLQLGDIYGSKNNFSAGLGLFYQLNEQLNFGMRVMNINRARLADFQDEQLPTIFSLGALYAFSEKAFWAVDVEKDLIHPVNVRSGIEIQAHEVFAVRFGLTTHPFQATFGFGLKFKMIQLDIASTWHTQLGLSPSGALLFKF